MITQNDYFGKGRSVYTVNRHIEEIGTNFKDGSHILYVNGSYRGEDPIGRLMQDFSCKKAKDMHYKELANGVKHFKEGGGRNMVCDAVEEYAKRRAEKEAKKVAKEVAKETSVKTTIEDAISYGMGKEQIIGKVNEKYGITKKEAERLYDIYAGAALQ